MYLLQFSDFLHHFKRSFFMYYYRLTFQMRR